MITRAPIRPTDLHSRRFRLSAGPAAAAEARDRVRAAIRTWDVPVDPDVAVLLTSELVTNAIKHEAGQTITLFITCTYGHLRVDVHDTSRFFPRLLDATGEEELGRGLQLVDTLADKWGCDLTADGKAVYFRLSFQPATRPAMASRGGPAAAHSGPAVAHASGTLLRFPRRSPRCHGPQS